MKKRIFFCIALWAILVSMANAQSPEITSIEPASGPVGTVVTVKGSGLAPVNNTIIFECLFTDAIWLVQIKADSPDGKTLQFKVPEYINPECAYTSTPPCPAVSRKTTPGSYGVSLKDGKTSKLLVFTVTISPTPTPGDGPVVDDLSPTSGPVGTVVTITGSGFAATGNIIIFQDALSAMLWKNEIPADSPDGKTLRFKVPEYMNPGCYYSTTACDAPSIKTKPGAYIVTVKNAKTTKTPLFTVTDALVTPTPGCKTGDVNGDGQVNIIDALILAQYCVGLPHIEILYPECFDMNHDGYIDIIDALLIARYSVGILL